ncbi:hypothetical protein VNI00_006739 [Paramarasmius palmivorus]|uniref:DUF6535 domain-containing protein n=1 Tax=Paramarasmius palmivorus TaxID=297713 RepID=A0AAW0D6Z5_9AGAR
MTSLPQASTTRPLPTRASSSQWAKTLFGLERDFSGSLPGNRSYTRDYEQEYPEDSYGEEIGKDARVWLAYLDERDLSDVEMLGGWRDTIDVLLVFAGLFSAVVTTFVVQTTQSLSPDYTQISASLLQELVAIQRASALGQSVATIQKSALSIGSETYSSTDVWVNALWLVSLCFGLSTALIAVLVKQWIQAYMTTISGTPRDRALIRQYRYMGLQRWKVSFIVGTLPILLHLALFIFLAGLVVFLSPLHSAISWALCAVTSHPSSPFSSALRAMSLLAVSILHSFSSRIRTAGIYEQDALRHGLRFTVDLAIRFFGHPVTSSENHQLRRSHGSGREHTGLQSQGSLLVAESLIWLYNTSITDMAINGIVVQAISGLPPDFEHIQKLRRGDIRESAVQMLRGCFTTDQRMRSGKHNTAERLVRTCVHLDILGAPTFRPYSLAFWKKGQEAGRPDLFVISAILLDRREDPWPLADLFIQFNGKPAELYLPAAVWKELLLVIKDGCRFDPSTQWVITQFLLWSAGPGYTQHMSGRVINSQIRTRDVANGDSKPMNLRALSEEVASFKHDISQTLHCLLTYNSPELKQWQLNDIYLNLYHIRCVLEMHQKVTENHLSGESLGGQVAVLESIERHLSFALDQVTSRQNEWALESGTIEFMLCQIGALLPHPFQREASLYRGSHNYLNTVLRLFKISISPSCFPLRSYSLRLDTVRLMTKSLETLAVTGHHEVNKTYFLRVSDFVSELMRVRAKDMYPAIHLAFVRCNGFRSVRTYFEALDIQEKRSENSDLWRVYISLARLIHAYLHGVFPQNGEYPGDQKDHLLYLTSKDAYFDGPNYFTWCHIHLGHILQQSSSNLALHDHGIDPRVREQFPHFFTHALSSSPSQSSENFIPPAPSPPPMPYIPLPSD